LIYKIIQIQPSKRTHLAPGTIKEIMKINAIFIFGLFLFGCSNNSICNNKRNEESNKVIVQKINLPNDLEQMNLLIMG
jgi:hypothetical protein